MLWANVWWTETRVPEFDAGENCGAEWNRGGENVRTSSPTLSEVEATVRRVNDYQSSAETSPSYEMPPGSEVGIGTIIEAETRAAVERIKRDHRTGELGGED